MRPHLQVRAHAHVHTRFASCLAARSHAHTRAHVHGHTLTHTCALTCTRTLMGARARPAPRRGCARRRRRWVPGGRPVRSARRTRPAAARECALTPRGRRGPMEAGCVGRRPARSPGSQIQRGRYLPGFLAASTRARGRRAARGPTGALRAMRAAAAPGLGVPRPDPAWPADYSRLSDDLWGPAWWEEREGALGSGSWARHRWKTITRLLGNSLSPGSVAETCTQRPETRRRSAVGRRGLAPRGGWVRCAFLPRRFPSAVCLFPALATPASPSRHKRSPASARGGQRAGSFLGTQPFPRAHRVPGLLFP